MSGTSADGADAALVNIESGRVTFHEAASTPYPAQLQSRLLELNTTGEIALSGLLDIDLQIATIFADTAAHLVKKAGGPDRIVAIGSHGQTIFHQPDGSFPGTLQLGNASIIAARTGVDTIADFRSADMACGGQGAPLTPAFNHAVLSTGHSRVVLNLGGIANVTFLEASSSQAKSAAGYDTGPANTLLDAWIKKHLGKPFDDGGSWAKSGVANDRLLRQLLSDPFFAKKPPKSTGPDYFNLMWLARHVEVMPQPLNPQDVQATLLELTAESAARAITDRFSQGVEVVLCGGGAHNLYLRERLAARCHLCKVTTTEEVCGLHVDHCESVAFAWLAYRYMSGLPGNMPEVTGASRSVVLGAMHKATRNSPVIS